MQSNILKIKVDSQRLSVNQFKDLYNIINKPDEVYYDKNDNALLYIRNLKGDEIIDKRDCIKVSVKLNKRQKGNSVNYVASAGRVKKKDSLSDPNRYKRIE